MRANADTPEDAARARRFGAEGIGLCRTEHMFLGERHHLVEAMILARTDTERDRALKALLPLQREDFVGILAAMDGLPVTIRLLDPPLHEFLPDRTELAVRIAAAEAHGDTPDAHDTALLAAVNRMHEENPMLGLRGVRLGLVVPGLVTMQVRAIAEAVAERRRADGDPHAEIMVPLVDTVEELRIVRAEVERVLAEVAEATGMPVDCPVGTMIELPRAALTAGRIAQEAAFFSFGTNDLTQTTWGFSRDDVEAAFFPAYLEQGIFKVSPFETIDREGVGRLVEIAVTEGRATRPDLKIGVRRARRGPGVRALLPWRRPGLRLLLPVPCPGRPAGGGPGRTPRYRGRRQQMTSTQEVGDRSPLSLATRYHARPRLLVVSGPALISRITPPGSAGAGPCSAPWSRARSPLSRSGESG